MLISYYVETPGSSTLKAVDVIKIVEGEKNIALKLYRFDFLPSLPECCARSNPVPIDTKEQKLKTLQKKKRSVTAALVCYPCRCI